MLTRAKAYRTTTAALSNRQLKKIKEIYASSLGSSRQSVIARSCWTAWICGLTGFGKATRHRFKFVFSAKSSLDGPPVDAVGGELRELTFPGQQAFVATKGGHDIEFASITIRTKDNARAVRREIRGVVNRLMARELNRLDVSDPQQPDIEVSLPARSQAYATSLPSGDNAGWPVRPAYRVSCVSLNWARACPIVSAATSGRWRPALAPGPSGSRPVGALAQLPGGQ